MWLQRAFDVTAWGTIRWSQQQFPNQRHSHLPVKGV